MTTDLHRHGILLRVVAPSTHKTAGFVAGAEIIKTSQGWSWRRIAPILSWIRRRPVKEVGQWLKGPAARKGWRFSMTKF